MLMYLLSSLIRIELAADFYVAPLAALLAAALSPSDFKEFELAPLLLKTA